MITRELMWLPSGAKEPRSLRVSVSLPEPHPTLGGYQCVLSVDGRLTYQGSECLGFPTRGEP